MKINISDQATNWYEQELNIESGDAIRFFVRYGGVGGRIPGFSLGISVEEPDIIHTSITKNGIVYFIDEADAWYFDHHDLTVTLDEQLDEPQFIYES